MNKDEIAGLVKRLMSKVFGNLTPGAIDHADLDGMAFLVEDAADALTTLSARVETLETHNSDAYIIVIDLAASLAAAISLLEKGGKAAKKAAPSDKMFDQMLRDYRKSLDRARQALAGDDHG